MLFIISAQIQWDIIPKPRPSWKRNFGNVVTINTNTEAQSDKVGNDLWHHLVQSLLLQCQLELTRTISFVNNPGVVNSKTQDNLFQILVILIDKKLFPDVHRELSASLCSLPHVLSLGTSEKSLTPSSLYSPFGHFFTLVRTPWAFCSEQFHLTQLFSWK